VLALALMGAAHPAAAQQMLQFHVAPDTAVGVVAGDTAELPLIWNSGYQMLYGRFTVHFDPAKMDVVGLRTNAFSGATLTPIGPGAVQVAGTGFVSGYNTVMLWLRVALQNGVPDGSYVWVNPDSVQVQFIGNATREYGSGIGVVCHATNRYGDVDGNARVDSRDALITLSAAVGLPVSGFNLPNGDVDGDGLANSRDALMMLSYAVQLPIYALNRVASGIPDNCPGFTPPGETMVMTAITTNGDSLYVLPAASTTPVNVPVPALSSGEEGHPRLAPNGTSIAYGCYDGNGPKICRIETDGSGYQQLTFGSEWGRYPDWDPTGTKIAYSSAPSYWIRHMDADGTDDSLVVSIPCCASVHAPWNRTGTQLAWAQSGGSPGLWVINRNGSGQTLIPTTPVSADGLSYPRWNVAGDSIAYTSSSYAYPGIWAVPVAGGTSNKIAPFVGIDRTFDWGAPGVTFFVGSPQSVRGLWLLTPSGVLRRLVAGTFINPAFRRNP